MGHFVGFRKDRHDRGARQPGVHARLVQLHALQRLAQGHQGTPALSCTSNDTTTTRSVIYACVVILKIYFLYRDGL